MKPYRFILITSVILLTTFALSLIPIRAQAPLPPPTATPTFTQKHEGTFVEDILSPLIVLVVGGILGGFASLYFKPYIEHKAERRKLRLAEESKNQQEQKTAAQRRVVDDVRLQTYLDRVGIEYNQTRVFGQPGTIPLDAIFTDIYIFNQPEAFRRSDIVQMQTDPGQSHRDTERVAGLEFLHHPEARRLFILGKPGAGKTTFLRYLTCQAARGNLGAQIPIMLTLRDWAESPTSLLHFIVQQFEQFGFPEPQTYVAHLLEDTDNALVLFDGLDEVREEMEQREKVVKMIRDFTRHYPRAQSIITCRVAATAHTLEGFTYAEVADFTPDQVRAYVRKWFRATPKKKEMFLIELEKEEHRSLRDLARTPLLLGLLCLNFESTLAFPARRVGLYTEALEALLNRWDAERGIKRDTIYGGLDTPRKHQLFAALAYPAFVQGRYLFEQPALARAVADYLHHLPDGEKTASNETVDGNAILRAIEAQHGILVERAHRIYAFSHLTFQEYYTARAIVETPTPQNLTDLMSHIAEDRWREVFLLTASMLGNADTFFTAFLYALDNLVCADPRLVDFIVWVAHKTVVNSPYKPAAVRAYYSHMAFELVLIHAIDRVLTNNRTLARALDLAFDRGHDFVQDFTRALTHTLASDRDLVYALDRVLNRDRALSPALDRALNRDHSLDFTFAFDLARTLDQALDHPLDHVLGLDCALNHALASAFDYTLAHAFNQILHEALDHFLNPGEAIKQALHLARNVELETFSTTLASLAVPPEDATPGAWAVFVRKLRGLMVEHRDLGHNWDFTQEQIRILKQYFAAARLLVRCLDVAYVTDRAAIEDRLLLPPKAKEVE